MYLKFKLTRTTFSPLSHIIGHKLFGFTVSIKTNILFKNSRSPKGWGLLNRLKTLIGSNNVWWKFGNSNLALIIQKKVFCFLTIKNKYNNYVKYFEFSEVFVFYCYLRVHYIITVWIFIFFLFSTFTKNAVFTGIL